jgi:DNA-binding CsgD family transcriptional regulator
VTDDPPESNANRARIAVALAIDDEELRERALGALDGCAERFVLAADVKTADVVIADHITTEGSLPIGSATILIGDRAAIEDAVRRGHAGGLSLSFSNDKLRIAIEAAVHGLTCTEAHAETRPMFDDEGEADASLPELTLREVEVLQQLITGASNKEIARRLDISIHTVKFHVASIVAKLGATGRTDAVARAMRLARSMI